MKKNSISEIIFISSFLIILFCPLIFLNTGKNNVSYNENRTLSAFPRFFIDGEINFNFTKEYETWFGDHMGLRKDLINANAWIQYTVFDKFLDTSDRYLGKNGDLIFATPAMIADYQHLNLRSSKEVEIIGDSYQKISNWLQNREIQFYYVQCYDKHSIYPEEFMDAVNQIGDISKTDQVIEYLEKNTTVNAISLKNILLQNKDMYTIFSHWGDPTHWTPRGAFIGYQYIMEQINQKNENRFRILSEEDYDIVIYDQGSVINDFIHEADEFEAFKIKTPLAEKLDTQIMGKWGEDKRHSAWVNPAAGNDTKVLLMCDSYTNSFIIEDFAESFHSTWLVWGDYTGELKEIVEMYQPDIVIYECAERVDRSPNICLLAETL